MAFSVCALSALAYSPTTSLVLEGLMFLVTAEPSTHSPPMKFFRIAVIFLPPNFLTHEAGTLVVEGPAGDQVLHGNSVIAGAESMLLVEVMRGVDGGPVDFDTQARPLRHGDLAALDLEWLLGQRLAVLPDPVRVDRGDLAGGGGADMGEPGERDVEMVVGVRTPGQAVVAAGLGHAHRALHGPEMGIGQRNVHRAEAQRMGQLPPIGRDHVGRGRQARCTAELGHDLTAGEAGFGAAGVLGIGEDAVHVLAEADGLVERPSAVRVQGHARIRKAPGDRGDGLDLLLAAQHAALELEIGEAVMVVGGFREPHHGLPRHRLLMAEVEPFGLAALAADIVELGFAPVADEEEITEGLDAVALLALAEQGCDRQVEMLTEQIE